ncbi:MAG: translocation/assembly module TamB domain-containing protein, partial [Cyanobacteria bacterium P01_D01_bin.50]
EFVAAFSYDGENARVDAATLQIGKTEYALQGGLNLNSGDINGRLVANSAKVQDIFAAVNVFNLEDLQGGVDNILNPEYGNAANVKVQPVGKPNSPILQQLRLFAEIVNLIQQQAALKQEDNSIEFDITGEYNAEVAVAGKLTNPQINFQLQGNDWQWRPQQEYVTMNPRKGVVVKQNQAIDINKIVAKGSYQNGIIQIQPAQLGVEGGLIALDGTLELDGLKSSGIVKVENLPVELAERFVELPVEIGGKFNLQANLGGNAFKPDIPQGAFSLTNGTINEKPLGELAGNFNYIDSIANLKTTPNSVVKVDATVAYPLQPNRKNSVALKARINNQAFALLDALTQNQLQWVEGNGEIAIAINGELNPQADTIQGLSDNLVATSTIQIENATIKTKQLDNEIKLSALGNLALNNQIIQIEEISGSLAESPFTITGNLPLFQPRSDTQPLNVVLGPGKLKFKGLYNGKIASNIEIYRTAINPIIAGNLTLKKGRVFIPQFADKETENTQKITQQRKFATKKVANKPLSTNSNLPINPTFQNFSVTIGKGFRFTNDLPRANFRMAGDITINGDLNNLRGDGEIELKRGSLFLLENSFFITRDRKQQVTFSPNRSLLNPQLDIEIQTTVVDAPSFDNLEAVDSEIRDNIVAAANPEQIDITITLQGEANELLASLGKNSSSGDACQPYETNIRVSELGTLTTNSLTQLEQFSNCINANSKVSIQTRNLLENPAVTLASTPSRNKTEILSLLGNRTFASLQKLEQQITSGNETELLESLVLDYLVAPLQAEITQEFLWIAQRPVNSLGKSIGLNRLQVFPALTGLKDINETSSARFVYDYEAGEFRLMYEARF